MASVVVTQSAEAVPMHAATAMQTVIIPIVRLFFVVIYHSFRTFSLLILNWRRFGGVLFCPFRIKIEGSVSIAEL